MAYAKFVQGLKGLTGTNYNFSTAKDVYDRLKSTAEGQATIDALIRGDDVKLNIDALPPYVPTVEAKAAESARRERNERKYPCTKYRGKQGACRDTGQCFYKPSTGQCTKFKYGTRVGIRARPTSPCATRELIADPTKCNAREGCTHTGNTCQRVYGTSPRRRRAYSPTAI